MVEAGEPRADDRRPGRPVVERAGSETACEAGREDDCRRPGLAGFGRERQRHRKHQDEVEADLVENPPEDRFDARFHLGGSYTLCPRT